MSRRTERAAEAIREVVSMAILMELNDPPHPGRDGNVLSRFRPTCDMPRFTFR